MLRVGTVGTSSIMRTIQEAIRLTDGMECRVVYSRTEEQGRAFAAEMGVPEHCTDYAAMLERSDLDLIDIASPNRFHAEQALAALEHGKHVIVEKPAAVTRGDVQRLIDAARANGVYFFEAITTLFMPQYEACRLLLPKLGRIEQAHITYAQYSSRYDAYLRGENPNIFNPAMQAGALNDRRLLRAYGRRPVRRAAGRPVSGGARPERHRSGRAADTDVSVPDVRDPHGEKRRPRQRLPHHG